MKSIIIFQIFSKYKSVDSLLLIYNYLKLYDRKNYMICPVFINLNNYKNITKINVLNTKSSAISLDNDEIFICGGLINNDYTFKAIIYNIKNETITELPNMKFKKYSHSLVLLPNKNILVFGGKNETYFWLPIEIYDFKKKEWSIVKQLSEYYLYSLVALLNGQILIIGGSEYISEKPVDKCFLYDFDTGIIKNIASLNKARYYFNRVLLPNGNVLVTGGCGNNLDILNSCEIYNPILDKWDIVASMNKPRYNHYLQLLNNNNLVFATGNENSNIFQDFNINDCEFYDYIQDKWTCYNNNSKNLDDLTILY